MEYTYPDYFEKFTCIGGACGDNCCAAGWQIAIDEESLRMYQNMKGDIGVRIRNSIDWKNGLFEQFDHKCALLNEQGLCDVYCDAGEDKMCVLCQRYPRHYEEYENLREISLSVSCPVATKLVLENRGRLKTYTTTDEVEEEFEDFDYLMFTILQNVRELLLDVTAKETDDVSLAERLARTLYVAHEVQKDVDKEEIFFIDDKVEELREKLLGQKAEDNDGQKTEDTDGQKTDDTTATAHHTSGYRATDQSFIAKQAGQKRTYMKAMMEELHKLEVLKADWTDLINDTIKLLYEDLSEEEYNKLTEDFNSYYQDREEEYEQLMAYFIYTYFCGSVYDYEPESKVRFGLAAILIIHEMDMAQFYKNAKKGKSTAKNTIKGKNQVNGSLSMEEQIEIVHRYSKEVEHSDLNLDDMERMVMRDSAFGLRRLYTCIAESFR